MKFAHAFRRATFYPDEVQKLKVPLNDTGLRFLEKIRDLGFDGVELGLELFDSPTDEAVAELRKQLDEVGMPCAAFRGGWGGLAHPKMGAQSRKSVERAIEVAAQLGATVVNTSVVTPPTDPGGLGATIGETICQGSSRLAREEDFEASAKALAKMADMAADRGIRISIEVHQHSIHDNSWATLHLLDLVDRPNIGANPDLGNIYWTYDTPEESSEAAIVALAPRSLYWHCKNLQRVNIPENQRSVFIQTPLPDGEIDYRFAISAMLEAGYDGYLAVEGMRFGDQLTGDARSLAYVKGIVEELAATKQPM